MNWIKENSLDIMIWSILFAIILAAYTVYQFSPDFEIKRTVITLTDCEHKELTAVDATASGSLF